MPLRGENIGTAYVRILADGSDLDRSVRDQMDDLDWDSMGRKGSAEFQEGWEKEREKAPNRNALRDSISGPLVRGQWLSEEFFRSKNWNEFRSGLEKEFGDAGKRAGQSLETKMFEGMDFDQLNRQLKNMTPMIVKAQKEIDKEVLAEQRKAQEEAAKLRAEGLSDEQRTNQQRVEDNRRTAQQRLADDLTAERLRRKGITLTKAAYKDLNELVERMAKGEDEIFLGKSFAERSRDRDMLKAQLKGLRLEMDRLGISTHTTNDRFRDNEERLYRMHPKLTKITNDMDRLGNTIGRSFGKGSRNDFVNFMGVVASGVSRIALTAIPRAIGAITSYVGKLSQAAADGKSVLGVLGRDVGKIVGGLAGGIGGLFLIIGPLVSIFSQLLGAAMALVSTIGMGLVSAAGSAAGALLPLGAGIATLILGFKNLHGEAKKAAGGVLDEFKGLGDAAAEGLIDPKRIGQDLRFDTHGFAEQMNIIRGMVKDLRPLVQAVGSSMGYAIDVFIDRINKANGPWEKFIDSMDGGNDKIGWLATNSRIAGRVITEAFGGLLGMLRALRPAGHDLLSWLRDVTTSFDNWINKGSGQKAVVDFMDDAAQSAKELAGFLGAVWGVFTTLVDAGQNSGDSLFSSLTKTLEDWNKNLKADGGAGLREWFSDSARFAKKLGDAVLDLLGLFKDLDTQTSREIATFAFESLARVLRTINAVLGPVVKLFDGLNRATNGAAGGVAAAALVFPRLMTPINNMRSSTGGLINNLRNTETRMGALKSAASGLAGAGGLALITDASRRGGNAVGGLENILGGAAVGFAVGGPIGAAVGGLGGAFLTMAQHSAKAGDNAREAYLKIKNIDSIKAAKASLQDLKGTLDQVTGAYTGATRAAALQKLQDSDLIEVAGKFGISARTVVNAAMGQKGAMEALYPAIGKVESQIRGLNERQAELADRRERLENIDLSMDESGAMTRRVNEAITAIDEETLSIEKNKKELEGNLGVLRQMPGQLRQMGRETRNTAAATADYSGMLHGIPVEIRTKIEADGIIPSVRGVAKVAEKYDLVDRKQIKTLIAASGADATVKEVLKVIARTKELDRQAPNPKLKADPSNANEVIRNVENALGILGRKVFSPKIDVQSNALTAAQATNQWLSTIQDETVWIDVQRRGGRTPVTAVGGLFNYAQTRMIGEAGPEAVVPLNRPLGAVDPSVRWLSAIAQGKEPPKMARGGVVGGGKTVNVGGITVVSPSADPGAVAQQTINRLVASAY